MDSITVFCAKYLFLLIPLLFMIAWIQLNKKLQKEMAAATMFAFVLAVLLDKLASKLYSDPRPFVTQHITPLVAHSADNGFPSEHTLFSVTIAAVIVFYNRKLGLIAFGFTLIVGWSRVAAKVHSPIDIIGAIAIGAAVAYVGVILAKKIMAANKKQAG
jgi:undecaprenyl-diphosphatase